VHSHSHAHPAPHPGDRSGSARALSIALGLTVAYGLVQIVTGIWFNSLALIADAVHNVSDGAAIALALGAAWAAGLPARGARTFGWRRAEILAALVNGLALVVISVGIFIEAYRRYGEAPDVSGGGVLVVGLIGIVANGIPVLIMLRASTGDDLNLRGAVIHAATDVLGSAGAAASGLIVLLTGWQTADTLIGAGIGLVVLLSSWGLIRESLRILMEVAPGDCNPNEVGQAMADHPGVKEVHDLHIWTITSPLGPCHRRHRSRPRPAPARARGPGADAVSDRPHDAPDRPRPLPARAAAPAGRGGDPEIGAAERARAARPMNFRCAARL